MVWILAVVRPGGSSMVQRRLLFMACVQQDGLGERMRWQWDWGQLLDMIRVWWVCRCGGGLLGILSYDCKTQQTWCALTGEMCNGWKWS